MKKPLFFLMLLIITLPAYSQDNLIINFNLGNFGIGGNIPLNDDYNSETIITLINIGIEHKRSNIGMEFTPFKVFDWKKMNSEETAVGAYSLFNFDFYWNIINFDFDISSIYIGPFVSINYFFIENDIDWNRYIFTGGLHIGFRGNFGRVNYNIVSVELGYRSIDGRSKYFIGAKIDIPVCIASIFYLTVLSSYETE